MSLYENLYIILFFDHVIVRNISNAPTIMLDLQFQINYRERLEIPDASRERNKLITTDIHLFETTTLTQTIRDTGHLVTSCHEHFLREGEVRGGRGIREGN